MHTSLEFPDVLRLIEDRAAAFRAAVAAAPSLDAQVPSCPEWTLFDLVEHLGSNRRVWALTLAAGPEATGKAKFQGPAAPRDREALLDWFDASVQELLKALREVGPDRGCWTWWATSQSPHTSGAVARHQLQEIAVHTYDAQLTIGAVPPELLPQEVALDGVEEFVSTCVATASPWPHEPAVLDYHVTEGRSWRLWFSADGARYARLPDPEAAEAPDASTHSSAAKLVLACYGRFPVDALEIEGDRLVLDRLVEWEPE